MTFIPPNLKHNFDECQISFPVFSNYKNPRFNGVTHDWVLLNGFARINPVKTLAMFSAAFLKKYLV